MLSRSLSQYEYLLVFTFPDDEVIAALEKFVKANNIASGRFQAIGSVSSATLAWWSADKKNVEKQTHDGQFELVSLLGNITSNADGPRIHAHAAIVGPNGIIAGHCVSLTPRASVEVSMTVFDTPAIRTLNEDFNLWTIDLSDPT